MTASITHLKTNNVTPWTQADLDAQIALGNFPPGTLISDITLSTDWNSDHIIDTTGASNGDVLTVVSGAAEWVTPTSGGSPAGASGQIQFNNSGAFGGSTLYYDPVNSRVGLNVAVPLNPFHIQNIESGIIPIISIRGRDQAGNVDNANGVGFYFANNTAGNRQWAIADTLSGAGIRCIGFSIDGYNALSGARANLVLGTDTTTVGVGGIVRTGCALSVEANSLTRIGLLVRQTAGSTLNLQEWQTSAGTILNQITSLGYSLITAPASANRDTFQQIRATDGVGGVNRYVMAYDTASTRLRLTSPNGSSNLTIEISNGSTGFTNSFGYSFNYAAGNNGFTSSATGFECLTEGNSWYLRGGNDTVRLVVQGRAAQTADQIRVQDNSSNIYFKVGGKRTLTANNDYTAQIDALFTPNTGVNAVAMNINATSGNGTAANGTLIGNQVAVISNATSNSLSSLIGAQYYPQVTGTQSVSSVQGFRVQSVVNMTGGVLGITNLYSSRIADVFISSGTVTNQYGVYVDDLINATNNFAIYTGKGRHRFGDNTASTLIGFYGATPVVQPAAYTVTNGATDRSYDANATTLDEISDVLATLISDLKSIGLIG